MKRFGAYFLCLLCWMSVTEKANAAFTIVNYQLYNSANIATLSEEEHYNEGVMALARCSWEEAARQFHIVACSFPDSELGQISFYYLGVAFYNLKEYDFANNAFNSFIEVNNDPAYFESAVEYKYAIACQFQNGALHRYFGKRYLPKWSSSTNEAIEIFDEVISTVPCHDLAARSLFAKASIMWRKGWYDESIELYQQLIRRFPKHELAPESYLCISQVYLYQCSDEIFDPDLLALSEINLRRFRDSFPREERICNVEEDILAIKEYSAQYLYKTGRYYERKKHPNASLIYYQSAVDQFPDTPTAAFCRNRIAVLSICIEEVEECEENADA